MMNQKGIFDGQFSQALGMRKRPQPDFMSILMGMLSRPGMFQGRNSQFQQKFGWLNGDPRREPMGMPQASNQPMLAPRRRLY